LACVTSLRPSKEEVSLGKIAAKTLETFKRQLNGIKKVGCLREISHSFDLLSGPLFLSSMTSSYFERTNCSCC